MPHYKSLWELPSHAIAAGAKTHEVHMTYRSELGSKVGWAYNEFQDYVRLYTEYGQVQVDCMKGLHSFDYPSIRIFQNPIYVWKNNGVYALELSKNRSIFCLDNEIVTYNEWLKRRKVYDLAELRKRLS